VQLPSNCRAKQSPSWVETLQRHRQRALRSNSPCEVPPPGTLLVASVFSEVISVAPLARGSAARLCAVRQYRADMTGGSTVRYHRVRGALICSSRKNQTMLGHCCPTSQIGLCHGSEPANCSFLGRVIRIRFRACNRCLSFGLRHSRQMVRIVRLAGDIRAIWRRRVRPPIPPFPKTDDLVAHAP
jgi:hypothetical protein